MRNLKTYGSYHSSISEIKSQLYHSVLERYRGEDEDRYDRPDTWLKKYTYEGMDKWPSEDTVSELLDRYSNQKDVTIYRGMNFETKESYDKFVSDIKDGKLETGGISSWSRDKRTAWQFAVTRPTYFLNMELARAEDKRSKEREYMIGYRGIILKCEIKEGIGIDTRRSKFATEDEIILPKGDYTVEIEAIKPFKELIKERDPSDVIMELTETDVKEDSFNAQFFKYIVFNNSVISENAKDHLFKMFMPKSKPTVEITKEKMIWDRSKFTTNIQVTYRDGMPFMMFFYAEVLGEKYADRLVKISDDILNALIDKIGEDDDFETTTIEGNIAYWSQYFSKYGTSRLVNKYKNLIQGRLAKEYKKLSNDDMFMTDRVRDINNIKDPAKKSDAINDYAKDIERALKNILKMTA